ncbi:helix-turn-helix domain-containing protein [Azorhizobium oxalatiphilum]|uniref:helix-turn-helix domain-containing protein n=1 Tax=Azorhizobium oxalatiphilum TaxID=980631 RepID=UPI00166309FC|nr:helix-turn-helix domain-containing protein [Azorhizobium oxalatiphilum]
MVNGAQIRAARALLGWDQQLLADRAQIAVRTLSSFEDGSRSPRARVRDAIVTTLINAGIIFSVTDEGVGVFLRSAQSAD